MIARRALRSITALHLTVDALTTARILDQESTRAPAIPGTLSTRMPRDALPSTTAQRQTVAALKTVNTQIQEHQHAAATRDTHST